MSWSSHVKYRLLVYICLYFQIFPAKFFYDSRQFWCYFRYFWCSNPPGIHYNHAWQTETRYQSSIITWKFSKKHHLKSSYIQFTYATNLTILSIRGNDDQADPAERPDGPWRSWRRREILAQRPWDSIPRRAEGRSPWIDSLIHIILYHIILY